MNVKKIHSFIWNIFYFLLIYFNISPCNGTVFNVTITEIQHILKTGIGCVLPPVFTLTINIQDGSKIKTRLTRNEGVQSDSPIFVFKEDQAGHVKLMRQDIEPITDVGFYQDTKNSASIAVTCIKHKDVYIPELLGTFVYKMKEYMLSPTNSSPNAYTTGGAKYLYQMTQINHHYHPYSHDYRTLPGIDFPNHLQFNKKDLQIDSLHPDQISSHHRESSHHRQGSSLHRHRRQITIKRPYIIDVLVVVDYRIYREWLERAPGATLEKRDELAKFQLKRYFSHFINAVDMRYRKIPNPELNFQVKLTGFVIADREIAYPFTELRKEPAEPRDLLDADIALKDFRNWINDTRELPSHDHAMLFTGYNLYTVSPNKTKLLHTAGLAFIGSMCRTNGDSVSIIEDHGGFQNVATAAHELGHSLGALHDGEKNECDSNFRYIMATSGYGPVPPELRQNQWHFSECSLKYFKNFTSNIARNGYTCLTETYSNASTVAHNEMPGQLYNPDEQCRLIWGPDSYLCRGVEFGNAGNICTAMYCRDPNTVSDCVLHTSARGTSCGDKKWCVDGKCIFSSRAPEKDGKCVLGDQPGIAFTQTFEKLSCDELVAKTPAFCYQEKVNARCCESCSKQYTWKLGCEYGDKIRGCQPWHCNGVLSDRTKCCGTCMIGQQIYTSPKPVFTDTPVTVTPDLTPPTICRDRASVNGQKCKDFVATNGHHLCYEEQIQTFCCQTCNAIQRRRLPDCPYGDRSPTLCKQFSNLTEEICEHNKDNCCETCYKGPPSGADNIRHGLSLFLCVCLLFIL